jgi:hypothetical protein
MKTLKELWLENGEKPFWARLGSEFYYMQAVSLDGEFALGSGPNGNNLTRYLNDDEKWTLCDDPRKPKEKLVLWRCVKGHTYGDPNIRGYSGVGTITFAMIHKAYSVGDLSTDPLSRTAYPDHWERIDLRELLEGGE